MTVIDLLFGGRERVIAAAVLRGADGLVLVDPGPSSCLPALEAGLARLGGNVRDVRQILLTHIHLDHAGATGSIVARAPTARVLVHERGARHMVDPARLLASATRLHGDRMDALWGRFEPVPAAQVTALTGGERLDIAGRTMRVAHTPGHAVHHVAYLDEVDGTAYVGDTCGIRVAGDYTIAATPPPDIDLALWSKSLDLIEDWRPATLLLTHFGPVGAARAHIANYRRVLTATGEVVARSLDAGDSDEDRAAAFSAQMRQSLRRALSESEAQAAEAAAPFEQIWAGLARYWRKQAER
ncbi:MAG: MBL fold metallo-hydrolase [Acidobacteriota bacterium]|nr:MBL fold metallo-hydrolase [Acidobacteriota bacterium]